ncbi:conserved domain protein [delta proteobacterium NaphS2]|nr:conserved domain protein [delta proteobacterium NaphS2]
MGWNRRSNRSQKPISTLKVVLKLSRFGGVEITLEKSEIQNTLNKYKLFSLY